MIISPEAYFVKDQEWIDLKKESMILPINSWSEIKKFIMKICKDYGKCVEADSKIKEIEEFSAMLH